MSEPLTAEQLAELEARCTDRTRAHIDAEEALSLIREVRRLRAIKFLNQPLDPIGQAIMDSGIIKATMKDAAEQPYVEPDLACGYCTRHGHFVGETCPGCSG